MRNWILRGTVLLLALVMGVSALLAGTFAWDPEQQALNDVLGEDATVYVTLQKLEKTVNGAVTNKPVPTAVFRLYKEDGTLLGGPFATDSKGQIKVMLSPGNYYFEETASADGFTYDRDASGNSIKKYPFTVKDSDMEITITAYNRRSGTDNVVIEGEKTWDLKGWSVSLPRYITVHLMQGSAVVDTQRVYPDASGRWTYQFRAPKFDQNGKKITYTVQEEPVDGYHATYSGYDILNTYIAPIELDLPVITKAVKGKNAPKETFYFVLEGSSGNPMPNGASGRMLEVSRSGKGTVSLGSIVFSEPGDYVYTIYEEEDSDYNWEYDSAVYTVTFHIRRNGSRLTGDYTIKKDGRTASSLVFTNTYDPIDITKKVTISGQKTWYHMDNPEDDWPEYIIVKIYADGVQVQSRRVTEADDWKYSFELPMYNAIGREIKYTVDEDAIADYSKKVSGYDLINTYVGEPDKPDPTPPVDPDDPPEDPDKPDKPDKPAKTGEEFDLSFWIAIMVFALSGFLLMVILWITNPPYKGKRVMKEGKRLLPSKRKR